MSATREGPFPAALLIPLGIGIVQPLKGGRAVQSPSLLHCCIAHFAFGICCPAQGGPTWRYLRWLHCSMQMPPEKVISQHWVFPAVNLLSPNTKQDPASTPLVLIVLGSDWVHPKGDHSPQHLLAAGYRDQRQWAAVELVDPEPSTKPRPGVPEHL